MHWASYPTDMQAPSKINFPFRPCSVFSGGLLLGESLYDPLSLLKTNSSVLEMKQRANSKSRNVFRTISWGEKNVMMWLTSSVQVHHTTGSSWQQREGRMFQHPLTTEGCICRIVSAAGGNYQALSETLLHQRAIGSGIPAKLCY